MKEPYNRIIFVMFLLFSFPAPAFANGGIPFWLNTIQAVVATSGIGGIGDLLSGSLITFICLVFIILIETWFLKKRYFKNINTKKILKVVSVSNIASTIIGGLFLWCTFYMSVYMFNPKSIEPLLLGPLFEIFNILPQNSIIFILIITFYNVFFCILSYLIELPITKHYFKSAYDNKTISKGVLWSNILSYTLSFFLMLPIYYFLYVILRTII